MKLSRFEQTIGELLRDRDAPEEEHYQHTANCPPLTSFSVGISQNWPGGERAHVSQCAYCQKLVAAHWGAEPPGWLTLARYILDPDTFPDRQAMERYLEFERPPQNAVLRRFLAWRGLLGIPVEVAEAALRNLAGLFVTLPAPPLTIALAGEPEKASFPFKDFPDLGVSLGLSRDDEGALRVTLIPSGQRLEREYFWAAISGIGDPVFVEITLDSAIKELAFSVGQASELVLQHGQECFVAVGRGPFQT